MSGVCKACNKVLSSYEMIMREVTIEDGKTMKVQEDMCKTCRDYSYIRYFDEDDFLLVDSIARLTGAKGEDDE